MSMVNVCGRYVRKPSMSKAHFESIATVLANNRPPKEGVQRNAWNDIVLDFIHLGQMVNDRFDTARFIDRCNTLPSELEGGAA